MQPRACAILISAVALAALAFPAPAQAPAALPEIPKPSCAKPGEYPGRIASERQKRTWQAELATYSECMKKFAETQRALSEMHINAANAAINEHNAMVRAVNDEVLKAAQ